MDPSTATRAIYGFGPFQLDAATRRLVCNGEPVALSDRQIDLLLMFVAHAGQVLSKDSLIEAAWKDVAVSDNSLEQAVSALRRILGSPPPGTRYIETLARRGYRFDAPVVHTTPRYTDEALEAMLAPHRAFVEGRAALETLERDAVARAGAIFDEIVRTSPDYASGHIGLANALALYFESTRTDDVPDRLALTKAIHHAEEGCRLDPSSGEAWATLALVSHQSGDAVQAVAAGRRAAALEPDNWRHFIRLAYVSWGEERLRAAHRALKLLPDLALAHWLAATVHIARQAFGEAEAELLAGTAAQDRQREGGRFTAVGLHLLLGLLRLASGDEAAALQQFARELAFEEAAHIYTREACANSWCGIGAVRLRQGDPKAAVAAFDSALKSVPGHPAASAASAALSGEAHRPPSRARLDGRLTHLRKQGSSVEAAMTEGIYEALIGRHEQAARLVHAAVEQAPAGNAAWMLPVDPLFHVGAHPRLWAPVLTLLRSRAA
jgi:DNA-binding winged helix-turn-helix (wHTH) protein/cytochrome c-type biogenesis protein CcmH/NrfG